MENGANPHFGGAAHETDPSRPEDVGTLALGAVHWQRRDKSGKLARFARPSVRRGVSPRCVCARSHVGAAFLTEWLIVGAFAIVLHPPSRPVPVENSGRTGRLTDTRLACRRHSLITLLYWQVWRPKVCSLFSYILLYCYALLN